MKLLKKLTSALIALTLLTVTAQGSYGYETVDIRLDGIHTNVGALLIGRTTYVPFDSANEVLSNGKADVSGSPYEMTASSSFLTVKARAGDCYIEAEGRYIGGSDTIVIDGMLYVPIRSIAKAYDAEVEWVDATRSVDLYSGSGSIISGDEYYSSDEVYWLSRIISAEAKGEPMNGKIMVGNVILNRVESENFPSTIYDVIFDDKFGVQFTPAVDGSLYHAPTADSIIAAKLCLEGYTLSNKALYFLNPRWATNFWVPNNRPYLTTIGSHDFYA